MDVDELHRFGEAPRASLLRAYSENEVAHLERVLATPCADLHVRVNLLRTSRDDLLHDLSAALPGFQLAKHPVLFDVITIMRKPADDSLEPLIRLDTNRALKQGVERFNERRRLGIPSGEVFVDRVCGEAVLRGADIFVKGVRAASGGLDVGHRVTVYADLHGQLLRGAVHSGSTDGMRLLGVGVCCLERSAIFREESGLAIRMAHVVDGDLPPLSQLSDGRLYVQSLPSLTVAHVLSARPGERVLDLCAAPGSKSTHVATNFLGHAAGSLLVACERNHGKLAKLAQLCKTLGLTCVEPTRADSTRLVGEEEEKEKDEGAAAPPGAARRRKKGGTRVPGLAFPPESFDRVLVDPPCSALGLRPRLVQASVAGDAFGTQAAYQLSFVWTAVRLLKVGGVLIYSTCTLAPEENEEQVAEMLARYPCLTLVPAEPRVGSAGRTPALTDEQLRMVQRFEPSDGHEGFFIAKFIKTRPFGELVETAPPGVIVRGGGGGQGGGDLGEPRRGLVAAALALVVLASTAALTVARWHAHKPSR